MTLSGPHPDRPASAPRECGQPDCNQTADEQQVQDKDDAQAGLQESRRMLSRPLRPRRASRRRAPACAAYVLNVKHRRMIRTRGRRSTRVGCAPPGFRRFRRGVFPRLDPGVEGRTSVHVSSPAASAPEGPAHTATSQSPKPTSPDHHPTRGDRNAPHLTERHWWPPLGRSHGRQRAVFMTATGQFLLAIDKRVRKTSDGVMVRTHPPGGGDL